MVEVESLVKVYEVNGKEAPPGDGHNAVRVRSARFSDRVELEVAGVRYMVMARSLQCAIENAINLK